MTAFLAVLALGIGVLAQGQNLVAQVLRPGSSEEGAPRSLIQNLDLRFQDFVTEHEESWWLSWYTDKAPEPEEDPDGFPLTLNSPASDPIAGDAEAVDIDTETQTLGPLARSELEILRFFRSALEQLGTEDSSIDASQVALRGAGSALGAVRHWFGSLLGLFSMLFLLPIYTWYLLFEIERIHSFIRRYTPVMERERMSRIGQQIGHAISAFFRGRLLVSLLKGLFISAGLAVAGIPYALFLGVLSGMLSLIPFVGAMLGFVFTFLVGLLDLELVPLAVGTGLIFGLAEALEGYVLVPKILGDSLGLHPLVVFVAVFMGGASLGMFGFLIALPLTATIVILIRELVLPALTEFADEPPEPPVVVAGAVADSVAIPAQPTESAGCPSLLRSPGRASASVAEGPGSRPEIRHRMPEAPSRGAWAVSDILGQRVPSWCPPSQPCPIPPRSVSATPARPCSPLKRCAG